MYVVQPEYPYYLPMRTSMYGMGSDEVRPLKQKHLSRLSPVMWTLQTGYPRPEIAAPIPPAPNGMGNSGPSNTNLVRGALVVAGAIALFAVVQKMRGRPIVQNMLPPWPGIGPLFSYAEGIGHAYALTPFIG